MRRVPLALLALCALACQGKAGGVDEDPSSRAFQAVEFGGKTTQGEDVSLADYRGKVVLVNVWASWCKPCKKELPELQKMHHAFGDDFSVLGIAVDKQRTQPAVLTLMRAADINYPVILDADGASTRTFGVNGYPTSLLIDRNGEIRWRREGLIAPGDTEAQTAIRAALEAG